MTAEHPLYRDLPRTLTPAEAARWKAVRDPEEMLLPREVALMFRVNVKTVIRWCTTGRLDARRTPGGHWRVVAESARKLLNPLDEAETDQYRQSR